MKTAFVIAEYHPFHNGHAHMAAQLHALGYEAVIACMSGNFVQRGEPALLPVQVRAAAALACGVDLVLQLPCRAAAASAGRFAAAGVAAAVAAGADALAFGAETPDTDALRAVTAALRQDRFPALLRERLDTGVPFHTARAAAADALCPGAAALLAGPNNILAVEYLAALEAMERSGHRIPQPLPLPRLGAAHDGAPAEGIASASWLRGQPPQLWQAFVPAAAFRLYQQAVAAGNCLDPVRWEQTALALLRSRTRGDLAALPDATEGLDALLHRAIRENTRLEDIHAAVKSKRYTLSRVRRLVLAAALGWDAPEREFALLPQEATEEGAAPGGDMPEREAAPTRLATAPAEAFRAADLPYLRVLGATEAGKQALSAIVRSSSIPVSPSLAALERLGGTAAEAARREAAATDLYALCLRQPVSCGEEYRLPFLTDRP